MIISRIIFILISLLIASCATQTNDIEVSVTIPDSNLLRHLHYLSSDELQGRKVGSSGGALAQGYLVEQLKKAGVQPFGQEYLAPFIIERSFNDLKANNVIAYVPGTKKTEKFIVLSAHFDHIGGQGKRIYNGADDNASGTAALLHYAKRLQQRPLGYSVILLFTDGEESNLKGAKAFVAQNQQLMTSIILNINLDMIAGNRRTKKLQYISRSLETLLTEKQMAAYISNFESAPVQVKKGFRGVGFNNQNNKVKWEVASDHGVFYKNNIPFIYFGVGTHSNYHQISDTYQNANHEFFLNAVETIYQQLIFLDQNL